MARGKEKIMKLNALALGLAGAIVSAGCMLLLTVGGSFGFYQNAAEMMQQHHMFYAPNLLGTITGMIEAAIIAFAGLYAFGWIYNRLTK